MTLVTKLTATIGTMVAATLALTLLKLAKVGVVAGWSWWVVAVPLWGVWALAVATALVLLFSVACERGRMRFEKWVAQ